MAISFNTIPFKSSPGSVPGGPAGSRFPTGQSSRPSMFSAKDKKSGAGVAAGLRRNGRSVEYREGSSPSGPGRSVFPTRLPNRTRSSSTAAPATTARRGFVASFFNRFRKSS